jgi:hypothetical protein
MKASFAPSRSGQKWSEHVRGRHDWHHALWNVLMFQAWREAQENPGKTTVETPEAFALAG